MARPWWREIALWWPAQRALIVAEAIGTGPLFCLGRRVGVHPLLRAVPPRSSLGAYSPERLLVGHGPALDADATSALREALASSRSDIPKLLTKLPSVIRLLRYIKIKRRFDYVPFSRANIYARDDHQCQYLSLIHI